MSDTYYPGWEAFVDGNITPIYIADGAFMAVPITTGKHITTLKYLPKPFDSGRMVVLGSLILIIITLAALKALGRKRISRYTLTMKNGNLTAEELHKNVPSNWYNESLKVDRFQTYWHKRRFHEVKYVLTKVNGKVLDIGSNDGTFSKVILDGTSAKELIGLDVIKKTVDWANKHWKYTKKMKFVVADAHKLPFSANSFDAVVALEVLEHVFDPSKVLSEVKRVLKPGGYAVFLVPSDSTLFKCIWFLWLHFYPRGKIWRDTHIQTYRNNYLIKISKKIGFKIEVDRKFILGMLHLVKVTK